MRTAYNEFGFLLNKETGALEGFALGFDFCAEHERGFPYLRNAIGLPDKAFPQGIEDRTATAVPQDLVFEEYQLGLRDRRFKKKKPAAVLYSRQSYGDSRFDNLPVAERIKSLDAEFPCEFNSKWFREGKDDVVSAWSSREGFCFHVQGAENVARLKELHAAFLTKGLAYGDGRILGFLRTSPALMLADAIPAEAREQVLQADQAALHLQNCIDACGIAKALADAGRKYIALSGAWRDGPDSELMFFLNPADQKAFHFGWFSEGELREWIAGTGPIVDGRAIEQMLKKNDPDWGIHLLRGLNAIGVKQRVHEKYVWLDAEKTKIGVRLEVTKDTEHLMPSGIYPLEQLQPFVENGVALSKAEKAAEAAARAAGVES